MSRNRRQARRPPARNEQEPGADRPVEPGKAQIRPSPRRRPPIDPVTGRIGNAPDGFAHFWMALPVSVSRVPLPDLAVSGVGSRVVPSASLRLGGPAAVGPAAQIFSLVCSV